MTATVEQMREALALTKSIIYDQERREYYMRRFNKEIHEYCEHWEHYHGK